jgi:UDP-N-acetylmuramoylalanine--D-glutamate ligase
MIRVRGFEGRRVAVFGLARTGLTAARALVAGGAEAACWDEKPEARAAAKAEGLTVVDLSAADWSGYDSLLLSPGVPLTHPAPHWTAERARAAGVEIIGDIEVFARTVASYDVNSRPKIAAITGTNGKSTTTALLGHIAREAGKDAQIGGNIGLGVLGLDDMHSGAIYVLELSSYQLDLTHSLKADAAVLLNITPDHLDRHGGMDGYVAAKRRVFQNQGKGDTAIVSVDDAYALGICSELMAANRRTILPITAGRAISKGVYALQGMLYDATGERTMEVADLNRAPALQGRHNWQNACAAYAAAVALGIEPDVAAAALQTFPGLAHRMENIGQIGKVRFVNDSKATNADAARQAMSAIPRFRWIAGGRSKAGGIEPLTDLFGRVAKAYLIGEAAEDFAGTLDGNAPYQLCGDLEAATTMALRDAATSGEDEVVLLSPACASFDQFADFEQRGEMFRLIVQRLGETGSQQAAG